MDGRSKLRKASLVGLDQFLEFGEAWHPAHHGREAVCEHLKVQERVLTALVANLRCGYAPTNLSGRRFPKLSRTDKNLYRKMAVSL